MGSRGCNPCIVNCDDMRPKPNRANMEQAIDDQGDLGGVPFDGDLYLIVNKKDAIICLLAVILLANIVCSAICCCKGTRTSGKYMRASLVAMDSDDDDVEVQQ